MFDNRAPRVQPIPQGPAESEVVKESVHWSVMNDGGILPALAKIAYSSISL